MLPTDPTQKQPLIKGLDQLNSDGPTTGPPRKRNGEDQNGTSWPLKIYGRPSWEGGRLGQGCGCHIPGICFSSDFQDIWNRFGEVQEVAMKKFIYTYIIIHIIHIYIMYMAIFIYTL